MIDLSFLPLKIQNALDSTDTDILSELRFRTGYPIFGLYGGKKLYLSEKGVTLNRENAIVCSQDTIAETMENVTEKSLYAFNDRLKQGFITSKNGVRIGVAGDCVFDNGKIITIKKISSLNIRIPHEIKNCSSKIFNRLFLKEVFNTLIVSPPAKGKTTILKDLARKFNEYTDYSVLIIDERGEFGQISGENIDLIKFSDKNYALNYAIRSMSPHIVITDELQTQDDWKSAEQASTGGIKIIASCHGKGAEDLQKKECFNKNVFERYVFLDGEKPAGTVKEIADKDFTPL
ncbi:MAG: hypothetical protein IJQ23_01465 [Clostridia bacterium]|nr:hypothetical protein [Clostridia bacterium]